MLSQDEVRFLAILVQKGHLPKSDAEKVLVASQQQGASGLDDLLCRSGRFDAGRLHFLRCTGGEVPPPVPGYDFVAAAGFGGTSLVFRAREKASGKDVALKIMHRELHQDALARRRFVHEAKLLMALDHPNIVKGYRVGRVKEEDGAERLVFVMEWIAGRSLLTQLREGRRFEEDLALYIILQTARALQAMHEQGILHRDVKPDNILLTEDQLVKLIDLGFATTLDDVEEVSGDTTLGTAAYMSPEQARGTGDLDVRSDIYSLGATLYQVMVGELPFAGQGTQEQLAARILEELSSPELQSRRVSPHMNYFIRKMMEQDRDFRYRDVAELVSDIEEQIRGKKTLSFAPQGSEAAALLDRSLSASDVPGRPAPADRKGPEEPPRFPTRRRRR